MNLHQQLMAYLHRKHIRTFGDSISKITSTRIHLLGNEFSDLYPEAIEWKEENLFERKTLGLAEDLKAEGFMELDTSTLEIFLTEKGYKEAYRLNRPLKHFCSRHWKWLIGTSIALLGIILMLTEALAIA